MSLLTLLRRRSLGEGSFSYVFRALFSTDDPAPTASSLTIEEGGPLSSDGDLNQFSIIGGELNHNGAATARYFANATRTRELGEAIRLRVRRSINTADFTLFLHQGSTDDQLRFAGQTLQGGGAVVLSTTETGLGSFDLLLVTLGTGCLAYLRSGSSGPYTLRWVTNAGTGVVQPGLAGTTSATGRTVFYDDMRHYDTPLFSAASDVYSFRVATPVNGTTATMQANALTEWIVTTLPVASSILIHLRKQDSTNYWMIDINATGDIRLFEVVGGTSTQRAGATAIVLVGQRVVVETAGTTFRVYTNGVFRIQYASATNFQTATGVEVNTLGTSGAISELISWPGARTFQTGV